MGWRKGGNGMYVGRLGLEGAGIGSARVPLSGPDPTTQVNSVLC